MSILSVQKRSITNMIMPVLSMIRRTGSLSVQAAFENGFFWRQNWKLLQGFPAAASALIPDEAPLLRLQAAVNVFCSVSLGQTTKTRTFCFSTEPDAEDSAVAEDTTALSKRPGFSGTFMFHVRSEAQTSINRGLEPDYLIVLLNILRIKSEYFDSRQKQQRVISRQTLSWWKQSVSPAPDDHLMLMLRD